MGGGCTDWWRGAALSDIERKQQVDFSRRFTRRKIATALGLLALAFTVVAILLQQAFAPDFPFYKVLIGVHGVGYTCVCLYLGAWFNYRGLGRRLLPVIALTVGLAILGALFGFGVATVANARGLMAELHQVPRLVAIVGLGAAVLMGVPMLAISLFRNRQFATLQRDAEQDRLARVLSETQLRLLRAQIEPHFLFNTLGAVQQLAEQGAPRAAELTANLIAFLRASLDEMRSDTVTLADECRLIEAYLRVMQARLGDRLRFTITLPAALEQVRLPGMLLLTLVENAIKHGIEPALRGGEVAVTAGRVDGILRLQVRDTGIGLAGDAVDGTGLANARQRLELAHHGAATLSLVALDDGTLADITLPVVA
jgi:signal transduction histidine kinase